MKKRILCTALAAVMLSGSVQAAEFKTRCDSQKGIVSVEWNAEEDYNKPVLIYLSDDNEDGFTIDQISGKNISDKLKAFSEADFINGKFSAQLTLPKDISSGWYIVTAEDYKATDDIPAVPLSARQVRVYIADSDMVADAIRAVNSASESNIDSVFKDKKDILGVPADSDYTHDAGKIFLDLKAGSLQTLEEIYDLFVKSKAAGAVKNADEANMENILTQYGPELGIELSEDYTKYKDSINPLLANAFKSIAPDKRCHEALKNAFSEMAAVGVLNSSNRTEITDVLEKYNKVFNLDLNGEYSKTDKIEFNKVLERKNFSSADAVKKVFDDKIDEIKNKKSDNSSDSRRPSGQSGRKDSTSYQPVKPTETDKPGPPKDDDIPKIEFNDLDNAAWAKEAIYALAEKKIVSGYSDGSFKPNNNITRNEFITMLVLSYGLLDESAQYDFTDGDGGAWYAKYIASAKKAGILAGYEDGSFGDGSLVTREDMAVFVYRLSGIMKQEPEEIFGDDSDISDYAKEAVYSLYKEGIINGMGDGGFAPSANATRAQAAKILYSVMGEGNNA